MELFTFFTKVFNLSKPNWIQEIPPHIINVQVNSQCLIKNCAMKNQGMVVERHAFLTMSVVGGECSA
jgi:hypothetical protein